MLDSGMRLGPYEILSVLGAGGMGEVYRARDTKLNRDVAIKVLPELSAADPDRLARFQREARALAALNHPGVAAIYGFEESNGVPALVMELVEGPTLAELLARPHDRSISVDAALPIARQIVDALDAAHEKGIVHRDLKPANIKVAVDGTVKILDFGLAKAAADEAVETDLAHSAAPTQHATKTGLVLGTAAYMSPEQSRGQSVDKRAAFGCVLFEMLGGRSPFGAETISDSIAATLTKDPEWRALPANLPPSIVRLLQRCLDKDPKRRLRDIGDARIELDTPKDRDTPAAAPTHSHRRAVTLAALVAALAAIVGASAWLLGTRRADRGPLNVQLRRLTDFVGLEESPAISPDGKTVAFVAAVDGKRQIWLRLLAGGGPLQITHDTVDHQQPRWTPDSSALLYYTPPARLGEFGSVWEIPALGGIARRVSSALGGTDISHDGKFITVSRVEDGGVQLVILARDGSEVRRVQLLPAGFEGLVAYPRWSPDDRMIAVQLNSSTDFNQQIVVVPASGGTSREIARGDFLSGHAWLPDGSGLIFSSSTGSTVLYPPTYNLRSVRADGRDERQLTFGDESYLNPDLDSSSRIVAGRLRVSSDIWRVPIDGSPSENTNRAVRITRQTGQAQTPSRSPDEQDLVYLSDSGGHGNLWVVKTDGTNARQITFERDPTVSVGVPIWSPVGDRIVYIQTRLGRTALWIVNADGSDNHELVRGSWASWSPDGRWVYYQAVGPSPFCLEKIAIDGGASMTVRCGGAGAPAAGGSVLYFVTPVRSEIAAWGAWEIHAASPEAAPSSVTLGRVEGDRSPIAPNLFHMFLSPDEKSLVMPLTDGVTTNLWLQPTDGGPMRQVTDFGSRPILIARRVSWSKDGKSVYAPVAETDSDVVLLDGLLR